MIEGCRGVDLLARLSIVCWWLHVRAWISGVSHILDLPIRLAGTNTSLIRNAHHCILSGPRSGLRSLRPTLLHTLVLHCSLPRSVSCHLHVLACILTIQYDVNVDSVLSALISPPLNIIHEHFGLRKVIHVSIHKTHVIFSCRWKMAEMAVLNNQDCWLP